MISEISSRVHARVSPDDASVPNGFTLARTGTGGAHDALWRCGEIRRVPYGELRRCVVTKRKDRAEQHLKSGKHRFTLGQDDDPGFPDHLRSRTSTSKMRMGSEIEGRLPIVTFADALMIKTCNTVFTMKICWI